MAHKMRTDDAGDLATVCVAIAKVLLAMLFLALVLTCMRWEHQDVMMGVV